MDGTERASELARVAVMHRAPAGVVPSPFSLGPVKWWIVRCLVNQINGVLAQDEQVRVTAVANTVLGYLPGYGGSSPIYMHPGKAAVLTNRHMLLVS